MVASDAYLEHALEEYNDKVNELESGDSQEELLEAYVNRACILMMMDYRTSALEDLESADEIIQDLEDGGIHVDDGTFVKTYVAMGDLLLEQEGDPMAAYSEAGTRIAKLPADARHFDYRSLVRTIIDVIGNMLDNDGSDYAEPYFERGTTLLLTRNDPWSRNRMMDLTNLEGERAETNGNFEECIIHYGKAIEIGMELMGRNQLEDPEEMVMALVYKAEAELNLDMNGDFLRDIGAAITVCDEMVKCNQFDDTEFLTGLHHEAASVLMHMGRVEEAEKHLMAAMTLSVQGASDYINSQTNRDA